MSAPLSSNLSWELMNPLLASTLNPIIASPLSSSQILTSIVLINGETTFGHKLGRVLRGWFITDLNGLATIYRSQPLNNKTLSLTSSAAVTINIGVF